MDNVLPFRIKSIKAVKRKKANKMKALDIINNKPDDENFSESLAFLYNEILKDSKSEEGKDKE